MKKLYLPLLFIFLMAGSLSAQIFSDDFESYTAGQHLASQAGNPWTTWSNAPGGSEDPLVSSAQAHQGSNSFFVEWNNNCVLLLGDSTEGRYKVSFYIYIPSGKTGYYNLFAKLAGYNSENGMQIIFNNFGQGQIDAGGENAAQFNFNYNEWIYVENYVDLDNDWAEIYINGNYIYDWPWSAGALGFSIPKQLAGSNFNSSWTTARSRTSGVFYDDVFHASSPLQESPRNFTANLAGTLVSLQWDTPENGSPASYYIYRNGKQFKEVTTTSYTDTLTYPGTYNYDIKAHYSNGGSSGFAGSVDVFLEGGIDRDYVLVEIGTGITCYYCPGASMGADDMIANGDPVAVIEYHYGSTDPFNNVESDIRIDEYYEMSSAPITYFDGGHPMVGGDHTQSLFPSFHPVAMDRSEVVSIFDLSLDAQFTGTTDTTFNVTVKVTKTYEYSGSDVRLFLALTETHIPYSWQGMSEINNTCRAMYPDAYGTTDTFPLNEEQTFEYTITIPADYIIENCELIAFVQDYSSKEVMQTRQVNLGQIVGIAEEGMIYTNVYPNPASNILNVQSASTIKQITVFDVNGRMIKQMATDSKKVRLDISSIKSGLYMMRVNTTKGENVKQFIVR